ncbi:acyl-CoA thioesterase [Chitinilyticum piscinae]|uniref:Acyl-CoA thioesterase n=1 Tax=Chitinilyticum piscinae TaxID=2866724 RepID=A0A8J7K9B2_9NEIS|nr:thioesterase family protein [Chitinilyticum piscinae]MBE9607819.1 acyl-CoA thioesterase [Chitinilyticum piscinae]
MRPALTHSILVTPPFHDIDLMEVVWHGHYVKYFELARSALLASFDYDYPGMRASGYAWPVVDLAVRYSRPARFGQPLRVTATIVEWENRLKVSYRIHDAASGALLTKGATTQVAVNVASGEMCYVSPDVLFEKLGVPKP